MYKKLAVAVAFLLGFATIAQAEEVVRKLPAPQTKGGIPLMEAITARKSTREFSAKKIDDQTLSDILYAAWGISHESKRTIPTSMNKQNLNVYVVTPEGAWLYQAEDNSLKQISNQDLRHFFNQQDYVKDAVLHLVYTGTDPKNSPLHAGSAYQNVGLYTASRGMNNVVRGYFDKDGVAQALKLKPEEVIVSQVIGWPYM